MYGYVYLSTISQSIQDVAFSHALVIYVRVGIPTCVCVAINLLCYLTVIPLGRLFPYVYTVGCWMPC